MDPAMHPGLEVKGLKILKYSIQYPRTLGAEN